MVYLEREQSFVTLNKRQDQDHERDVSAIIYVTTVILPSIIYRKDTSESRAMTSETLVHQARACFQAFQ